MAFIRNIVILISLCAVLAVAFPQEPRRLRPHHVWPVVLLPHGTPHSPQVPENQDSLAEPSQNLDDDDVNVDNLDSDDIQDNEDLEVNEDIKAIVQVPKKPHHHSHSQQELEDEESVTESSQDLEDDLAIDNLADKANNDENLENSEVDEDTDVNEVLEDNEDTKAIVQEPNHSPPNHIIPHHPYVPHGKPHHHPHSPQEIEDEDSVTETSQAPDDDLSVVNEANNEESIEDAMVKEYAQVNGDAEVNDDTEVNEDAEGNEGAEDAVVDEETVIDQAK